MGPCAMNMLVSVFILAVPVCNSGGGGWGGGGSEQGQVRSSSKFLSFGIIVSFFPLLSHFLCLMVTFLHRAKIYSAIILIIVYGFVCCCFFVFMEVKELIFSLITI